MSNVTRTGPGAKVALWVGPLMVIDAIAPGGGVTGGVDDGEPGTGAGDSTPESLLLQAERPRPMNQRRHEITAQTAHVERPDVFIDRDE